MGRIVQFPKLNEIQFVEESISAPTSFNHLPIDKVWHKDALRSWQSYKPYKQKIQHGDKKCITIHREDDNDVYFRILDSCGNIVDISGLGYTDNKVPTVFSIYDSNSSYTDEQGNTTQLSFHAWSFYFSDFNLSDGIYYLRIYVEFYDGITLVETKKYISEPLNIRSQWNDTLVIQSTNTTNIQDVIFNYDISQSTGYKGFVFQPVFNLRVEGDIIDYDFESNDNFFTEQDNEERNLKPADWLQKTLQIGASRGVPVYMMDKVNHYLNAQSVKINDRRISKANGAKLSKDESKERGLYSGEIDIIDYDFDDAQTSKRGAKILFYEEPANPYYIFNAGFAEIPVILYAGAYIPSTTERTALISSLNGAYSNYYNLRGTFSYDSGAVYYQNADDEDYTPIEAKVMTEYFDIEITTNAINDTFKVNLINRDLVLYGGVIWGDGTIENFSNPAGNSSTSFLISHSYSVADDYTVRVFPTTWLNQISILNHQHQSTINNITGDLPSGLNYFVMSGKAADFSGLVSGIDLSIIANCRKNIKQFSITNAGIVGFDGDIFSQYPAIGILGNSQDWSELNAVSFYKCAITSAEVEGFIVDFYDFTPKLSPMFMELRQNPAAPVTNTPATTYKAALIAAGGTILTD